MGRLDTPCLPTPQQYLERAHAFRKVGGRQPLVKFACRGQDKDDLSKVLVMYFPLRCEVIFVGGD